MRRAAALVVGAVLVAAGCDGGSNDAVVATSAPATTAPSTAPTSTAPVAASAPATTTTLPTGDPATLAAELVAAERTIRDAAASPDAVTAAGRVQQRAYRRLNMNPDWEATVAAAMPPELRPAFDANVAAATIRRRLAEQRAATTTAPPAPTAPAAPTTTVAPTLPAWTIRPPKPADELVGYYREAEAATGVPWYYLAAINFIETRMGRIVGVSSAGAEGPMQFLPTTWDSCCTGDRWDDRDAIMGAATYLRLSGAPDDMTAAVWQYNPNEVYLEMVTRYAEVMAADERAYRGYHAWEVFYGTGGGDVRLPEGYSSAEPIDAAAYVAAHPGDRVSATFP